MDEIKAPRKPASWIAIPWYPSLIVTAFTVDLARSTSVSIGAATRPLLAVIVVSLLAIAIGWKLLDDRHRGGAFAMAALMATFAGNDMRLLAVGGVIMAVLVVDRNVRRLAIPDRLWPRISEGASIGAALVIIANLIPWLAPAPRVGPTPEIGHVTAPNMYVLLSDGLGRRDILADLGHDSGPFETFLEGSGFEVATDSYANQGTTALSLASMLNGAPLEATGADPVHPTPAQLHTAINGNRLGQILRAGGYETIVISSGYEQVAWRSADRFIDTGQLNEFELVFLDKTLLGALPGRQALELKSNSYRERALAETRALRELLTEQISRPRFVFLHLPIPHPPYVFGPECEATPGEEPYYVIGPDGRPYKPADRLEIDARLGSDQAACAEQMAVDMVNGVIAADPQGVVIVLSDHGPDVRLNWFDPAEPGIHDRLANFFAARTPGRSKVFPPDLSLINFVPLLTREYFGLDMPIAERTAYIEKPVLGLVPVQISP